LIDGKLENFNQEIKKLTLSHSASLDTKSNELKGLVDKLTDVQDNKIAVLKSQLLVNIQG
jgi:hypothetical protein